VREGAIIPANVASSVTGLGSPARADALTVLAWPAATPSQFELVDEDDAHTTIAVTATTVELSRVLRPTYVRIRREGAPGDVMIDGAPAAPVANDAALEAAGAGWRYDAVNHWLWVKVSAAPAGTHVAIAP